MDHQQQMQPTQSNSIKSSPAILIHSNSTSTVISDEEALVASMHLPLPVLTNRTAPLRSVLKTSGLFNKADLESADKLNEFFANGNEFTLHRLLSDFGVNDLNIDMSELAKFDPLKLFEARTISEFLQNESFDQVNSPSEIQQSHADSVLPSAVACSSESFSTLCPPTSELPDKELFQIDPNGLKMEPDNPLVYTQLNSIDNFVFTPAMETPITHEFNFDPSVLAAFEHDYGYLSKRTTVVDTPSPSPITPSRSTVTRPLRTSSRLQSRATRIDFNQILNDNSCLSPTMSEDSTCRPSKRTRNSRHVHRATDIKTEDDLSYYLERRRKNNEASKMSRAARKQKFGDMDRRCSEYERVNTELRLKIATLEVVTANLKNGLIHNFQRKN